MIETKNSKLSAAQLCKANGWGIGTIISGTESYGEFGEHQNVSTRLILAVGEEMILFKDTINGGEGCCTDLSHRDWGAISFPKTDDEKENISVSVSGSTIYKAVSNYLKNDKTLLDKIDETINKKLNSGDYLDSVINKRVEEAIDIAISNKIKSVNLKEMTRQLVLERLEVTLK